MASFSVGIRPNQIVRVAICTQSDCEEQGIPIQVPDDQMTYDCTCGQVVATMLFDLYSHEKSLREHQRDRDARIESTVRWCYAPQLHLDKDGGEPLD